MSETFQNGLFEVQEILNLSLNQTYPQGTELYLGLEEFDFLYSEARKLNPKLPKREQVNGLRIRSNWGEFLARPLERQTRISDTWEPVYH